MTLNITVITDRHVYQSSDYRFTDFSNGDYHDDEKNQKIFFASGYAWVASVCFNGIGCTQSIHVSEWLSGVCKIMGNDGSFDDFLEQLKSADAWIASVSEKYRRHSFVIGAFVAGKPVFALVSNYERLNRAPADTADSNLSIHTQTLRSPKVIVSGQPQTIGRADRRLLKSLAGKTCDAEKVFSEMARLNKNAAENNKGVSSGCYTNYINRTQNGHGRPHGIDISAQQALKNSGFGDVSKLIRTKGNIRSFAFAHSQSTDEYHATQLSEKPNDAETHAQYAIFLANDKNDLPAAEKANRKALELNPNHIYALINLAKAVALQGRIEEAEKLFTQAIKSDATNESASYCYARFLDNNQRNPDLAYKILKNGAIAWPTSGRIQLLLGWVELSNLRSAEAETAFRRALELRADQMDAHTGLAFAMHNSKATIDVRMDAYLTALSMNPKHPVLHLNLAQLLFATERGDQAVMSLANARKFGLNADGQLEGYFYDIAYRLVDVVGAFESARRILNSRIRTNWHSSITVDHIATFNPKRAAALHKLSEAFAGRIEIDAIDRLAQELA